MDYGLSFTPNLLSIALTCATCLSPAPLLVRLARLGTSCLSTMSRPRHRHLRTNSQREIKHVINTLRQCMTTTRAQPHRNTSESKNTSVVQLHRANALVSRRTIVANGILSLSLTPPRIVGILAPRWYVPQAQQPLVLQQPQLAKIYLKSNAMDVARWDTTNRNVQIRINGPTTTTRRCMAPRARTPRHVLPRSPLPLLLQLASDGTGRVLHPMTRYCRAPLPSFTLLSSLIVSCYVFTTTSSLLSSTLVLQSASSIMTSPNPYISTSFLPLAPFTWHRHRTPCLVSV